MKKFPTITADPQICHGKPVITGTRVMVWQILELLEMGKTKEDIYFAYPSMPKRSIESVLHYAAERAKTETYVPFIKESGKYGVFA